MSTLLYPNIIVFYVCLEEKWRKTMPWWYSHQKWWKASLCPPFFLNLLFLVRWSVVDWAFLWVLTCCRQAVRFVLLIACIVSAVSIKSERPLRTCFSPKFFVRLLIAIPSILPPCSFFDLSRNKLYKCFHSYAEQNNRNRSYSRPQLQRSYHCSHLHR